jgi:YaiO family outer membrane protein
VIGVLRTGAWGLAVYTVLVGAKPMSAQGGPTIDVGGGVQRLTAGLGSWESVYARAAVPTGQANVWHGELMASREFGDRGIFAGLGNTHPFGRDWYTFLSSGTSAGGFYLPRFRADGFLSRKLGGEKQLVATIGTGYYAAKDPHRDLHFFMGGTYYFRAPVILEVGSSFNKSKPGSVVSAYSFVAVTQGREHNHYLILRLSSGTEAYQLIGPRAPISNFRSSAASLTLRKWIGPEWGINVIGETYGNPTYHRNGISVGAFARR